ncbi:MAG TPA: ArsR family transcriptional regulator [candidate division WOR-3 bacterium]|uniref:ArsR family transcriptional regulator n=1 Tax=candidate division WOR-3 bacterium TaxID=2052148 RepID=A0A9C9EP98_UNCW3|nr:ArsR family transcriptional regulator [candidate division WOR-3 bacterium]
MRKIERKKPMKEIMYRESRIAQVLGEPSKYLIVNLIFQEGPLSVSEIAKKVNRTQPTVSHHLAKLRSLEIVRYEAKNDGFYYWIKYPKELKMILTALNVFVQRSRKRLEHDT